MSRVQYDPTIYQGAAAYYRCGRPAYSRQLQTVLTEELDLDGTGRAFFDGGCGPGILDDSPTAGLCRLPPDL